eukprot:1668577-Rhodomonas_salina.2
MFVWVQATESGHDKKQRTTSTCNSDGVENLKKPFVLRRESFERCAGGVGGRVRDGCCSSTAPCDVAQLLRTSQTWRQLLRSSHHRTIIIGSDPLMS